ncbi:hypothetical protein [Saccharopolyspora shandongensis]|uniref:hypothetical protein n=1 Tax=Saccharopolyspora shandongensis TaxID=418495 RepID=UPI0033DAE70E
MAKNSFPMMQTGGNGTLGKVIRILVVVALVVLVVKFPADAAAFAKAAFSWAGTAIGGVVTFFRELAGR